MLPFQGTRREPAAEAEEQRTSSEANGRTSDPEAQEASQRRSQDVGVLQAGSAEPMRRSLVTLRNAVREDRRALTTEESQRECKERMWSLDRLC